MVALGVLPACALHLGSPARPSVEADPLGPAVERLLHSAAAEEESDQHDSFVDALVALGPPAVPHLAKALTDPDEHLRLASVEVLGKLRGEPVVDALLLALKDEDEDVRLKAVQALGVIADRRATQPLLEQLTKDGSPQVRYECLTSLGLIGDPAAVEVLVKGTNDADPNFRLWAMDALCQMNDPHASARAVALMGDPDANVRAQVITACGDALNTPDGHALLIALAVDADEFATTVWARRHLVSYLEHSSGGPDLREQMRAAGLKAVHGPHAVHAALLLGDLGDRAAVDQLIRAMRDPDPLIRHHVAFALGRIGDRRAVPALIAALHDPAELVAASAYNSLSWLAEDGDARAQEAVRSYTGKKFNQRLPR
jgi:HEAT repeat protein